MHREPTRSHPLSMFFLRTIAVVSLLTPISPLACARKDPSAPRPNETTVTFVKRAPSIGRLTIEESSTSIRLSGEARAPGHSSVAMTTESIERERKREEVLAVFERIITKKKITYEQLERREYRDGKAVPTPVSPLLGHSYIAETKNSMLVLTSASGTPVSEAERKELSRRLANLGKPDPFLEGIPDGPVRADQAAPQMGGGFLEIFEGGEQGADVGNVDVRFTGTRGRPEGPCGVFAFTLGVQMAGEPRLALQLRGEFLVRVADGAPIEFEMAGPARLAGREKVEGVDVALDGTGAMRASWRVTYL